jgi:hypothetical protein
VVTAHFFALKVGNQRCRHKQYDASYSTFLPFSFVTKCVLFGSIFIPQTVKHLQDSFEDFHRYSGAVVMRPTYANTKR